MDELKPNADELEKDVLDALEDAANPVESVVLEFSCYGTSREILVALEKLFREGKLGRFERVFPTTTGVKLDEYWTTRERADEILNEWGSK